MANNLNAVTIDFSSFRIKAATGIIKNSHSSFNSRSDADGVGPNILEIIDQTRKRKMKILNDENLNGCL